MSFVAYPSSESVSSLAYLYCLNNVYNRNYHYFPETQIPSNICPTVPSYMYSSNLLIPEIPISGMEPKLNNGIYPIQESFNVQNNNSHQEQWSSQTTPNSMLQECEGGRLNISKTPEIWRPFSPSPTKDPPNVRSGGKQCCLPSIIPSRVKIEHSKTSLFKPVKRKSYRCSNCSSSFTSSAQLISHLRVHTGSKPFACEHPDCPKTFARNEELTRHRRIHSGYRPHACHACGKTFGRKDHLAKHAKTHLHASEKRAYACAEPGCGHRYTRSDALTRHRTSAHATWRRGGKTAAETTGKEH